MPEVRYTGDMSRDPGALGPVADGVPALARDKGNFFTKAAAAGDVYGEVVRTDQTGGRWRRWDPYRSKVAAAIHRGGVPPVLEAAFAASPILYLGAASGTTVSHIADLAAPRSVFAVEFAPRAFQDLLEKLRPWENVFPIMADARQPATYASMVGQAGAIIQDVAQTGQVAILTDNAKAFLKGGAPAILFMKARSEDSAAHPERVFAKSRSDLEAAGFGDIHERDLEPYDRDHRAFLMRWRP